MQDEVSADFNKVSSHMHPRVGTTENMACCEMLGVVLALGPI